MIFVDFLYYVRADEYLPSNFFGFLWVRIIKGFCTHIHFWLAFWKSDRNVHKFSTSYRPQTIKVQVMYFIVYFRGFFEVKYLHFLELWIYFFEGLFFFQKLDNFFNIKLADMDSFGSNSLSYVHSIKHTRNSTIFNPLLRGL